MIRCHRRHDHGPAPWIAVLLSFTLLSPAFAAGKDGRKQDKEPQKPRLRLIASPAVGFTPVTTILSGQVTGIRPDDAGFCHPAVTWLRVNPGMLEEEAMRYHEDPACRHPESEAVAVTSFTKTMTLYDPGSYLIKLIVESSDGRRVESAYIPVQVLRVQ